MNHREQILRLRDHDQQMQVFGACVHEYKFRQVEEADVIAFEDWFGQRLPHAYRDFLLEIGTGAGPYFGLYQLDEMKSELKIICEDHAEESGKEIAPAHPICETVEQVIQAALNSKPSESLSLSPMRPGGFVPIATRGCDYVTVLLTNGNFEGHVFDSDGFASIGSSWASPRVPCGVDLQKSKSRVKELCSFTRWIELWLENSFSDLGVAF
jgi:hypothetical protein